MVRRTISSGERREPKRAAAHRLDAAVAAIEELEETARLFLLLRGERTRFLTKEQVAALRARYPIP